MVKFLLRRSRLSLMAACCGLLLLSACATLPPEEAVAERATARWNTLLSDDLVGAYEFLSPGYRSSVSSNQYQRSVLLNRVRWTGAQVNESECTETSCKVKISLDYAVYGAVPGVQSFESTQTVVESWVRVDGKWYYVPNK